jgi:hypothetical protein
MTGKAQIVFGWRRVFARRSAAQPVVDPLMVQFGTAFGGVMGWEFSLDKDGSWANTIGSQIGAHQPRTATG